MDRELFLKAVAKEQGRTYEDVAAEYGGAPQAPQAPGVVRTILPPTQEAMTAPTPNQFEPPAGELLNADGTALKEPPPAAPEESLTSVSSDINNLTQQQYDAALDVGDAEAQAAQNQVDIGTRDLAAQDKQIADFEKTNTRQQADADAAFESYKRIRAEIDKLPPIKDRRTDNQRTWGALSVALATFGDGVAASGGWTNSNFAKDTQSMIDNAVDRDIKLQQQNYENATKKADRAMDEYNIARTRLGDTRQAFEFAAGLRKERLGTSMEIEANKLTSATAREKALIAANQYKMVGKKEQMDALLTVMKTKDGIVRAYQLGLISKEEAAAQLRSLGSVEGSSSIPNNPGKTPSQKGTQNIEFAESDIDGFARTKEPSWYNADRTKTADEASQNYSAVKTYYAMATQALRVLKDPNASPEQKKAALSQYHTARSAVPQAITTMIGGGAAADAEAARAVSSWPSAPRPDLPDWLERAREFREQVLENRDTSPESLSNGFSVVQASYLSRMRALGYAPGSPQASAPAAKPASPTKPASNKAQKPQKPIPGVVTSKDQL